MNYSSRSLSDPAGSNALVAAIQWLQGTLLGTVATTVAVIVVAATGFMMLTGRIDWKRSVSAVIGCFILFGASSIVVGLQTFIGRDDQVDTAPTNIAPSPYPALPAPRSPAHNSYDPYAGASLPPG